MAAVNSAGARALYKARVPIFPKLVHGRFRALKWALLVLTLSVYYLLPWVRWPRGPGAPDQAVLVDFPHQRFYFFFIEIWPQEVYYITGLLVLAALGLFLITSVLGRVWCGYTCPQTIWTDLFIAVERLVEGDRNQRIRLDKAPWTAEKIAKRVTKHAIWLAVAALTGGAWVLYFHDAPTVAATLFEGTAPITAYIFIGLLTFTTYTLGGLMREQVCTFMCPWPRIQAALTDEDALSVTYRYDRGEPRGPHKKGDSWSGRGHCIDCRQCVAACPMGIDIRDGAQLECINCALCIDACDDIMAKVGLSRGLIAYDTDANIKRRQKGQKTTVHIFRPRTVMYAILFAAVAGLMLFGLSTRTPIGLNVLRDRNPPYVTLSDGSIRNAYTLKLLNKSTTAQTFRITVSGSGQARLRAIGVDTEGEALDVSAPPDSVRPLRVFVTIPKDALGASSIPLSFSVKNVATGRTAATDTVFLSRHEGGKP